MSQYLEAKRVLHASIPDRLVGRQNECEEVKNYMKQCFDESKSLSLYVNGPPGTGKTVLVNHVLDTLKSEYEFKQIFINCMSLKNIHSLYKSIMIELDNDSESTLSKRSTKDLLAKAVDLKITTAQHHIILVLDEIDQIETTIKVSTDLYKIFEWPFLKNSKLILIGIANSLDFTDRLLPRLQLKPNHQPKLINFTPYSRNDIIEIVKDRLKSVQVNGKSIIDERALMWCASKISSTSGDIRKMLDICRRSVEIIEKELAPKIQIGSIDNKENVSKVELKQVGMSHMMKIFNDINPMTNSNFDKNSMPLMHKLLLGTLLLCTKELKIKEIPFTKLLEKFKKVCSSYLASIDSDAEFVNLCTLVQDNGLVNLKKAREVRNFKVSLKIDEQELSEKLQDEALMSDILTNQLFK